MLYDTLVIGSGQAGLAAGYYLRQAGLSFALLEAGDAAGGSWPQFYDSLVLNSPARYSALPGLRFPGPPDRYPVRDEVAEYLRGYAGHFDLPILTRRRVERIERCGPWFRVWSGDPAPLMARTIVAATGSFGSPYQPSVEGRADYRGRVLHASAYRQPEPLRGQRVVVVGAGNGAVRIATELAAVARVTLATRQPIRSIPQRLLGRDIHFWLRLAGLDERQWLGQQSMPVYIAKSEQAALGAVAQRRAMFARFSSDGVIWPDGAAEPADTVLFATGYRPNLAYLADLGAFAPDGRVLQTQGRSTSVPGLYYVGLSRQRSVASATLRGVGPDARVVVEHLRRYSQMGARSAEDRNLYPLSPRGFMANPWSISGDMC